MFGLIRFAAVAVLYLIAALLIKKLKPKYEKYLWVGTAVAAVILYIGLSFFSVENAFVTFKSPESAYKYMYLKKTDLVVSGKTTDFVVGERSGTNSTILQKTKNGWKLGRKNNIILVSNTVKNDVVVNIWQYRTSHDYFISVTSMDKENNKLTVKDTLNSEVQSITRESASAKDGITTYYLTVNKPDLKYRLTANGTDFFIYD